VLASVQQTVSGQTLQVCLAAAREDWVGLATLNQKALVYQDGLIEGSPLHRLSPLPGAIAFEADGSTTHHQMPAGILDFGFEVSMGDIPLYSSEGASFGKGLVFGMFNCACGSIKMESHLPQMRACKIKRIVFYPLLLHALKNLTKFKWDVAPATVVAARNKLAAMQDLAAALRSCQEWGGFRAEFRLQGHGDPKQWLLELHSMLSAPPPFAATVGATVAGDDRRAFSQAGLDQYCRLVNAFGFSPVEKIKLPAKAASFGICLALCEQELATADRRAAGPASSARPAPHADAGEVPFSQWAPEEVGAWNLIPFRVVHANVGRAAAGWWVRNRLGHFKKRCASAHAAVQYYLANLQATDLRA
ncbi:unnamed protein product, partial [Effrenium voratum]